MERLEHVMKDLRGMARKLRDELDEANVVINDLYLEVETRNEMSLANEHHFDLALGAIYDLDVDLKNFINYEI